MSRLVTSSATTFPSQLELRLDYALVSAKYPSSLCSVSISHLYLDISSFRRFETAGASEVPIKMSSLASLTDPKAYHILAYGTLLGTTFFQSFIAGPVAFKAIPRPAFAQLQTAVTPVFFGLQSVLPVLMAVTWPGEKLATVGMAEVRRNSGPKGLLQSENIWTALVPMGLMLGTSLVNLLCLGPMTTKVMKERKHQGKIRRQVDCLSREALMMYSQKHETARSTLIRAPRLPRCSD